MTGRGDDEFGVIEMRGEEEGGEVGQPAEIDQLTQLVVQIRGDDGDPRAASEEELHFPARDVSAPNNDRRPGVQLQKDRQMIHGGRCAA